MSKKATIPVGMCAVLYRRDEPKPKEREPDIEKIAASREPSSNYDPWTATLIELTRFGNMLPVPNQFPRRINGFYRIAIA